MKKQINPTIKAHLIRSVFYLLLLLAVCAIPFALAQSRSRGTTKPGAIKPMLLPTLTSRISTVPKAPAVPANPDFAPPGMLEKQFSTLRTDGTVALASGAGSALVRNLAAPLFPDGGCGTPGPWSTATPGPPARYRAGSSTDGQYIYVYGGGNSSGGYYNDLWRWDPVSETWTQLANMPTAKQNIQGAYWNGKIYVPGGFNGAHITENAIYDIATNTWSTGAPLPAAQTGANVAFNNKIYNFGGNPGPQNTVTIYDIATNTWSNGAAMPVAITYGRAATSFNFAWYAGGITTVTVNTLYRYDFAANSWATMAPLQTARTSAELMTSPLGEQLYAVMGGDATFFTGVPQPVSVEIYSMGTNSWSYGNPVVTKAAAPSGGRTGGNTKLMVQGGVDNTTYYDTVQISVVPCGTPVPTPTSTPTPTGTPAGCQFHVLIAYADTDGLPTQLQSEILAEPNVVSVDLFDAGSGTPTLAQLQQYQIVVPFSNSAFLDPDTLGNNVADYVDGGGIVVQYGFSHYGPGQGFGLNGRWVTGNYNPYSYTTNLEGNTFTLGAHNAGHPLMAGVTTLNSNFANVVTPAAGATEVAQNSLGESLVAYRPVSGGHTTVGVTAYVGAAATESGDWGKVIVNAGNWLANCQGGSPTPTATATPTGSCSPGWQNEPAMTNARRNAATVVVGSNLYAITGFNAAPDYTTANERFNGSSWTTGAPIPLPHAQSRGTSVGTNIYVPGGYNSISSTGPLDTMQIYNTATDSWSSGAAMPGTRGGVATATFNGMVYIIAGYTTPFPTATNTVFIYNPGTNSYTTGAPMPGNQGNQVGVLFNGEIYVVGGGAAPGAQFAYNPVSNAWRTIAALPTTGGTCQSDAGFVLDNELWVVGCLGLPINQQVWIYNPGSDSWRAGPQYNVDHEGPGGALFNGRGFAVGGGAAGGGSTAVESVGGCGGQSPTPTSTATATATAVATATSTATATATATFTPTPTSCPTVTATATATATATVGPRSIPTPRPRPTPGPRP
jgi:N-acetylneuraminic acid mutarotase